MWRVACSIVLLGAGWGVLTGAVGGLFAIPLLFFLLRRCVHDALAVGAVAGVITAFLFQWLQDDPDWLEPSALIILFIAASALASAAVIWFCGNRSVV